MGVRRPTNGARKNIGLFPSLKNWSSEWYESLLERDMLFLVEIDPGVKRYWTQPFRIEWPGDDRPRIHVPDILVVRSHVRQVIEVKPEEKTLEEEFVLRTPLVSAICRQHGLEYCIVTEKFIQQEPRLSNVKLLFKYSRTDIGRCHQAQLFGFFKNREVAALEEVESIFRTSGMARNITYALLYRGLLTIDLNSSIHRDAAVRLSPGNVYKEPLA